MCFIMNFWRGGLKKRLCDWVFMFRFCDGKWLYGFKIVLDFFGFCFVIIIGILEIFGIDLLLKKKFFCVIYDVKCKSV